jgi:hypothetical protein
MAESSREKKARAAHWSASEGMRAVILEQAESRVQAAFSVSAAQQQRLAQVAVFLFAAAAVGAQVASGQAGTAKALLIAATAGFSFGGIASAYGLLSQRIQLPGFSPSWWAGADLSEIDAERAGSWRAGNLEQVLETAEKAMAVRRVTLAIGLVFGGLAAALLPFAAWLATNP